MAPYFQIVGAYSLIVWSLCKCESTVDFMRSSYEDEYGAETTPFVGRMSMDFEAKIRPTTNNHTSTLIFLHSLTEIGTTMMDKITGVKESFHFKHTQILFPTGSLRPYTPHERELRYIWNDVTEEGYRSKELLETFEPNYRDLKNLIMKEVSKGIPLHRIAIAGYAEGGPMALHMAYRIMPELAGCVILSSCLFKNSIVFKELREKRPAKLPKLLWVHGDRSPLFIHAKEQFDDLVELGVNGEFAVQPDVGAKMDHEQIDLLFIWILSNLEVPDGYVPPKKSTYATLAS